MCCSLCFADPARALEKTIQLVNVLPPINTAVLRELFRFLQKVQQFFFFFLPVLFLTSVCLKVVAMSSKNLMTAENVGVVIGPNILAKENQVRFCTFCCFVEF